MLKGLIVIDLSTVLAGPSVGTFLAELGADVLKIEHPEHPDVTRSWKLPSEKPGQSQSAYFSSINYKKKHKQLNLADEKDHREFIKLLSAADILISNFKKGDDVKLNITDSYLLEINPRLIIGKINGYGTLSDRVAYDLILQAESGFMSMNGTQESGPVKMPVALIDVLAAHQLKEGILLALYQREKTGRGQSVSVSLYDTAISSLVNQASNYLMAGYVPERIGSLHPNIAPYGDLFTTKDKATITFAIGSNTHFSKLCASIGLNSIVDESKFNNNQNRVINRKELARLIQDKISTYDSKVLLNELQNQNVPAGKVKKLDEVFKDEAAKSLIRGEDINGISTKRITSIAFKNTMS
ncbi:MAG: CoA transferase [Flavobacteriales bacterium]|nr:CoA transferase [Flavobacteriales bacterium]